MKTYKQRIKEFMQAKEDIVSEIIKEQGLYYNEKDEKLIDEWGEELCKRIFIDIKDFVKKIYNVHCVGLVGIGLAGSACPFCYYLKYENRKDKLRCDCAGAPHVSHDTECQYAMNHGFCDSPNSNYRYIQDRFRSEGAPTMFTIQRYKEIINEIEKGEDDK